MRRWFRRQKDDAWLSDTKALVVRLHVAANAREMGGPAEMAFERIWNNEAEPGDVEQLRAWAVARSLATNDVWVLRVYDEFLRLKGLTS